jgi:crotonobetainyl-CoA:carnitine CoA-transferase CaiB-like acyl-CoA transferase
MISGGVPLVWKQLSRNKKTITLSLSKPEGQELFCRLVEKLKADVVIESFRAGTFEQWNLGEERLRALSPGTATARPGPRRATRIGRRMIDGSRSPSRCRRSPSG